jgi:hypothetical protein
VLLSDSCVYTIVNIDKLAPVAAAGGPLECTERTRWVTAAKLLAKSQKEATGLPVLLADAKDCSRLLYWGVLTGLIVEEEHSTYVLDRLRPIDGAHTPQELVLLSTGRTIKPEFIRPYALCRTPEFIDAEAGAE